MDLGTILIVLPIFFLLYRGVEMLSDPHRLQLPWGGNTHEGRQKVTRESTRWGGKLGFNKTLLKNKKRREKLELLLLRSGNVFRWAPEDLLFYKEICSCLLAIFFWQASDSSPLFGLGGLVIGFLLPDVYLKGKVTSRKAEIQRQLPGFVDLLALTLESGLDLLAATERILEKMKPNPLRDELQTLIQENRLGTPRKEALQHLAFRTDLSDMQSLTSMIIQSEELGTGLAGVLRSYAEDMRNRRILRAEEIGGKAPVKLLLPMMVFFFPIVFVIIFGPLALNLMSSYK